MNQQDSKSNSVDNISSFYYRRAKNFDELLEDYDDYYSKIDLNSLVTTKDYVLNLRKTQNKSVQSSKSPFAADLKSVESKSSEVSSAPIQNSLK